MKLTTCVGVPAIFDGSYLKTALTLTHLAQFLSLKSCQNFGGDILVPLEMICVISDTSTHLHFELLLLKTNICIDYQEENVSANAAKYGTKNLLRVTIVDLPYNVLQVLNMNMPIPGKK